MDPFSIVAGTVGLLDVAFRLAKYLNDVKEGSEKIDEDVDTMYRIVSALASVVESIKTVFEADMAHTTDPIDSKDDNLKGLWKEVSRNVQTCNNTLEKLFNLISHIVGKESAAHHSKLDGFRKYLRKQSKEDEFIRIQKQLSDYHHALQTLLTSINIVFTKRVQSTSDRSFTQISSAIAELRASLKSQISSLQASTDSAVDSSLSRTLALAQQILPDASPNKYFFTPQPVSSIFTGREPALDQLKQWVLAPVSSNTPREQKRFVIYGLGGSGKTQFCSKFAQENRQSFWAVFWLDASSDDNAKQSYISVARVAEKNPPTEVAGKSWLSNSKSPWLLIIDNADDLKQPIETYFPDGERGCILITTRDHTLRRQGTCGDRYYHFEGLQQNEANSLLLKAAEHPRPWNSVTETLATTISKTLGLLPSALVHAGNAILNRVCKIEDYLTSYDRHWDRLRLLKSKSKILIEDETYTIIYATYETSYQGFEEKGTQAVQDAAYLLQIFSFLHRENVRVDIFLQAIINPQKERDQQARDKIEQQSSKRQVRPRSQSGKLRDTAIVFYEFIVSLGARPVLSDLLQWKDFPEDFDDSRLRMALAELQRMSLIDYNPTNESYSMNPLVHTWVRERAESKAEQAVWCHAAVTILTQAILLPPLANTEADEDFRRDLMPHVDYVQKRQKALQDRLRQNQRHKKRATWKFLPIYQPQLDRAKNLQLAKFSFVYVQCGRWQEAADLQFQVYEFLMQTFGMEHETTIRISQARASVIRQLDKLSEAAELQVKVLEACEALWGEDDLQTLEATSALGISRWQQGDFTGARALHTRALKGFTEVRGPDHSDTFKAMSELAGIHTKTLEFEQAIKLHTNAVSGLQKQLGLGHQDTVNAMVGLGMTYLERTIHATAQPGDLMEAHRIMLEVVKQRKGKLGKDHPFTLWAMADLARIKNAQGDHTEAESMFRAGITVAEADLGKDHIGTLYGKMYYGNVLICRKKYPEAENLLLVVVDTHQGKRPNHPDQLVALSFLLQCYRLWGKEKDVEKTRDRIETGLDAIGKRGHSWEKQLFNATIVQEGAIGVFSPIVPEPDEMAA